MSNLAGFVAVVIGLFAILGYFRTDGFTFTGSADLGSQTVYSSELASIRSLVNRTAGAADGNYDSLDMPRGTTFTVPTGSLLVITVVDLPGVAVTATATVTIGYADDAVGDSAAAPTNDVEVWARTYSGQPNPAPLRVAIPAGKIPWVRVQGVSGWTVPAAGVLD